MKGHDSIIRFHEAREEWGGGSYFNCFALMGCVELFTQQMLGRYVLILWLLHPHCDTAPSPQAHRHKFSLPKQCLRLAIMA